MPPSTAIPQAPASPAQPMPRSRKGEVSRAAILEGAMALARRDGLEGLTIGVLAERLGRSKSGVFAHFGSREELQLAVLREYAAHFVDRVLRPAVRAPRGLPRLQAIVDCWLVLLAEEIEAGCILIGGASEYDDRPGPLHDALAAIVSAWKGELVRAMEQARDCGHLRKDIDCEQMVFEIYGLMLMLHQDARLLHGKDSVRRARLGLQRLIDDARDGARSEAQGSAPHRAARPAAAATAPRAAARRAPRKSASHSDPDRR